MTTSTQIIIVKRIKLRCYRLLTIGTSETIRLKQKKRESVKQETSLCFSTNVILFAIEFGDSFSNVQNRSEISNSTKSSLFDYLREPAGKAFVHFVQTLKRFDRTSVCLSGNLRSIVNVTIYLISFEIFNELASKQT